MSLSVRTLLPMAADGIGPSLTCTRLVEGSHAAGADIDLLVTRARMKVQTPPVRSLLPRPMAALPYRWVQRPASRTLEDWYMSRIRPGDIAWLWPSVSLDTHDALHARGIPVVMEGINTRMKAARDVLDAAYDAFGAAPAHGITQARIDEEEAKFATAQAIFAPSPAVEAALAGTPLEHRLIASSYGIDTRQPLAPRPARDGNVVRFLFVGYACIRKGIHHLLDLWADMPGTAKLRLVGRIEPLIAERYADLLASDRVETVGFTRDVAPHYAASDVFVFPSLEEGDPLVIYEAALNGLPIVASRPGAGRMGAERGVARIVEPTAHDAFLQALIDLHDQPDARRQDGAAARAAVMDYDWHAIGARRMEQLATLPELALSAGGPVSAAQTPAPTPVAATVPARAARPPAVSVVLPAYNRATTITAAIDSVLRQTWQDFELLVVDDGSTDGTPDMVRAMADPRVRLLATPRNMGPSGARNVGIREARADWIAFQDSDDEWLPEKLERQMARLQAPGADWIACYCGMLIVGAVMATAGRTTVRYHPAPREDAVEGDIRDSLMRTSLVSTQMLVARRDALETVGGFDEDLPALVDWDLVLRLSEHGRFAFVDEPLVLQRFSANSITRDRQKRIRARTRILQKHAAALAKRPEVLLQHYRTQAGEHRALGEFREAARAIARARRLQPFSAKLWLHWMGLSALALLRPGPDRRG